MWAITATHVTQNFGYYVLLTELPTYMKNVLGWDLKDKVRTSSVLKQNKYISSSLQAFLSGLPYLAMWLVSIGGSILVDTIIERKLMRTTVIRKIANTIATMGPALALLGASFTGDHPTTAMVLLTVAVGCNGFIYSGEQSAMLDIANNFAGTLMGVINALGSLHIMVISSVRFYHF